MSESPDAEVEVPEVEVPEVPEIETPEGFISLADHTKKLDGMQKDVNVRYKQFKDEERKRIRTGERADNLDAQLKELQKTNANLEVPEVPDQYDKDYVEKIAARDVVIRQKAEHDADETRLAEEKTRNDEAQALVVEQADAAQVAVFDANMVALGVDIPAVKVAADKIIEHGISEGLTDFILEDPDGPLMVQYLDQNPTELDAMNKMSSLALFNHINSTVRAKAALLKPKTSNAPNPPIVPDGSGAPEVEADWEKGAKYS